ncbi:hypothetical protein BN14_05745 [Rhizoctonia solani AG-1 IB]|uniref:Uncharacterized protein n=1 Tax=Thanatephorus cucumeris (strain AG1-IB / isolate 7/3/14) TaxID=1108050 RepID=M5BX13_THACB|nr:hypothetical protein BN14_05745 [Rhizoctonia solani AG-1 IB]
MPVYQSNAEISFNHCIHVDFYVQNSPEAMKDNLSGTANIIHVLLNASNRRNICTPIAFQDFAQWHCQGFLTLPPVISAALSAAKLRAAVVNFVLLYPADSSTVPVSSPVSAYALSDSEESLATPPAGATLLPSLQSSANYCRNQGENTSQNALGESDAGPDGTELSEIEANGTEQKHTGKLSEISNEHTAEGERSKLMTIIPQLQGLWQAPAPAKDDWQPFSYEGWSEEEIQRHRQAFDPDCRQEEEMLYSFRLYSIYKGRWKIYKAKCKRQPQHSQPEQEDSVLTGSLHGTNCTLSPGLLVNLDDSSEDSETDLHWAAAQSANFWDNLEAQVVPVELSVGDVTNASQHFEEFPATNKVPPLQ